MIHVTTTCDTAETAKRLARAALEARLAACANVTPGIVSLFHWKGGVEEETEVSVTFKTTVARRADLVALIAAEHPYDLPVITWEEVAGTPEAEAWCQEETSST
jgi:periplasmic divalent cation tolerance protein